MEIPSSSPSGNPVLNDRQWAIILHLSGLAGFLVPGIGNWAAPLVIWLLKRTDNSTVDGVGKEVVNFQICYTLYSLVLGAVISILVWLLVGFLLIPLLGLLWLLWLIFMIIGAVKASNGEFYRYPGIIRFIS